MMHGSKFTMLVFNENVIVPPYCGVPRLSHQFPVEVVVAEVVIAADVVEAVVEGTVLVTKTVVEVASVVEVVFAAVAEIVLDDVQDVKMSETTIRQLSTIQNNPFFIWLLSLYFRLSSLKLPCSISCES
jgi:uncharacterized membrane protein (GlpM family)